MRLALAAPPVVCRERVLQAIQDGAYSRQDLSDDFAVSPFAASLSLALSDLTASGLITIAGTRISLARPSRRKAA